MGLHFNGLKFFGVRRMGGGKLKVSRRRFRGRVLGERESGREPESWELGGAWGSLGMV